MMFLLFGGDGYYPGGGMADFRGRFASIEDAVRVAESGVFVNSWSMRPKCEWWCVVSQETLEIVRACDGAEWWKEINQHTADMIEREGER